MKLILKVTDHPTVEAVECEKCGCRIWPVTALEAHTERHKLMEAGIVAGPNEELVKRGRGKVGSYNSARLNAPVARQSRNSD